MNATPEHAANGTNVDPAEIEKFDALASRFWDPQGEFGPLHKLNPIRLGYVADAAALSGAQVLDVGCGGGLLAEALAGRGAHVTGIDLSPSLLSVAELHALESGVSVAYRRISAEQLAVERPAAFDVVTCMEMLEHVPDPASVIGALARLVRPGGTIVVSTLNRTLKAFLFAIVGYASACAGCGLARTLPELLVARFFAGAAGAMMGPVGRLVLLRSTAKQNLVRAMSVLTMPALLGPVLGPRSVASSSPTAPGGGSFSSTFP